MQELIITTKRAKEVIDITTQINEILSGKKDGLVNLFILHTTTALTVADLDDGGTDLDYLDAFEKIIPRLHYHHPHNPEHMPDHILSATVGCSLTLPFQEGSLLLGMWQKVVLMEFDGPRQRKIIVSTL